MKRIHKLLSFSNSAPFLIVIFLSFFAIQALFAQGFFPMHDDTQVARVFEMKKSLSDGMFPVRWVEDLGYGYGYPLFNFYAPLAYYVGGFFNVVGFDALVSTKLMMGIGIVLAAITMYLLGKELFGNIGGMMCALFYEFASYHAVEIFVRGDVAEFFAYAFIPLIFYGILKAYRTQNTIFIAVGVVGYGSVILSHNLTAMMISPFVITFVVLLVVLSKKKIASAILLFPIVIFGILTTTFYWLPALSEIKYTNVLSQVGGGADFRDHYVCVGQLWDSPWGFGGSTKGCVDGMSFKIGKVMFLLSIASIFSLFYSFKKDKKMFLILLFFFLGLLFSLFLTLEVSKTLWEAVSPMAFFQYPWRFLIMISFFASLLSGSVFWLLENLLRNKKHKIVVLYASSLVVLIVFLMLQLKLFQPQHIYATNVSDFTNEQELKWRVSKVSDEYMPKNFRKPQSKEEIARERFVFNQEVGINSSIDNTQNIAIDAEVPSNTILTLNIAYFPAWTIFNDGYNGIKATDRGYVVPLLSGHRFINVRYAETDIERIGNIVSCISLFIFVIGIIYLQKKRRLVW